MKMQLAATQRPHPPPVPPRPSRQVVAEALKRSPRPPCPTRQAPPPPKTKPWRSATSEDQSISRNIVYESARESQEDKNKNDNEDSSKSNERNDTQQRLPESISTKVKENEKEEKEKDAKAEKEKEEATVVREKGDTDKNVTSTLQISKLSIAEAGKKMEEEKRELNVIKKEIEKPVAMPRSGPKLESCNNVMNNSSTAKSDDANQELQENVKMLTSTTATISSDDCATVVVIDEQEQEPERKVKLNEDNDNIHHQDWLEAGVRYSSTQITLQGDDGNAEDHLNGYEYIENDKFNDLDFSR